MLIKKQTISKIFPIVVLSFLANFVFYLPQSKAADQTTTHTTESDFKAGNLEATLEPNAYPGDVKLKRNKNTLTETTFDDFKSGINGNQNLERAGIAKNGDGELSLNQGYYYNYFSNPSASADSNYYQTVAFNSALNLVYVGTWYGGVSVINTQGTKTPNDDVLVNRYSTTSTPAIATNNIFHLNFEPANNLLYVGTVSGGLSVINTQGTINPGDDTLVKTYNASSSPALISNNRISATFYDPNLGILIVGIRGSGVTIIDTKKTISAADDTLVGHYTTSTTPAVTGIYVMDLTYDSTTSQLYVSCIGSDPNAGGLNVLSLNNTVTKADDTFVFNYKQTSTPSIGRNFSRNVSLDLANDIVFAGSGEVFGINRHGTLNPADDTIDMHYSSSTVPPLLDWGTQDLNYYPDKHYLAIGEYAAVTVIDTKGTNSQADDSLVGGYTTKTMPALTYNNPFAVILNTNSNLLYVAESDGEATLTAVDLDKKYTPSAKYISKPFLTSDTPNQALFWDQTKTADHGVNFQFRTGDSNATLIDDFNDGSTTNILDPGWGNFFNTIEESNGTVKLKNPTNPASWESVFIQFKFSDIPNSIPIGSTIRMKFRVNSNLDPYDLDTYITSDDWNDDETYFYPVSHDWQIATYTLVDPMSMVSLYISWYDNWQPTDSYEIDWITIEKPDASWDSWSSACSNQYECVLPDTTGKEWIQYRTNLSTTNENTSPSVESVTFGAGYQDQGTYTSKVVDAGHFADWKNITADLNLPAGTIAEIKVRTGNTASPDGSWSSWENVN